MRPGRTRCFTLLELLLVAMIIAALAGLLLPALALARQRTLVIQCAANLKQVGTAFHYYLADHNDSFPWTFSPVNATTGDPWANWALTLSGLGYLPPAYELDAAGNARFRSASPWLCPAQAGTFFPFLSAAADNWKLAAKCGMSYSYPIFKQPPRQGLGGGGGWGAGASSAVNCPNRPALGSEVKTPSATMNLCEYGTDCDGVYGGFNHIPVAPAFLSAMGRHFKIGGGTNLLFVDGHADYFPDGKALLAQWTRCATGSPCQLDYPFHTDWD